MADFSFSDLFFIVDRSISTDKMNKIGIIAFSRGISGSSIGIEAISEINKVDTSSETSSSPICLLPIILRENDSKTYKIIVLITIVVKKTPPFINYYINFAQ